MSRIAAEQGTPTPTSKERSEAPLLGTLRFLPYFRNQL